MNESTDNNGFTPVLGCGHRAKNPEHMRALALSTTDSDDEAIPAHPHCQPSHHTKVKSSSLNTANSFESLDVEDISDLNDTNYKTDEELPDLLSGSDSGSDTAEETDGSDIEEITNTKVSFSFSNVAQHWYVTLQLTQSLPTKTVPQHRKASHHTRSKKDAKRKATNKPAAASSASKQHCTTTIEDIKSEGEPLTRNSLVSSIGHGPKVHCSTFFLNLVNVNILRSRSFEAARFISFMRRYWLTLKGPLASLATSISSVFTEGGRY